MTDKYCSSCKTTKPVEEFHRRGSKYQPYCKACKKVQDKEYYKNHTPEMKEKIRYRKAEVSQGHKERVYSYLKSHPCVECGESNPIVLEFHHRNPEEKDTEVGRMICWNVSWSKIEREIEKCDVLCANCHRIVTAHQQGWWMTKVEGN